MPTSNQYSFNPTRDNFIAQALRKNGVLDDETGPSPGQIASCAFELEGLLKTYQSFGMALWAIEELVIPAPSIVGGTVTISNPAPLRIYEAFSRDSTNSSYPNDIEMTLISRAEYNNLSNKYSIGRPTQFWYDYQNQSGTLSVYPQPDTNFNTVGSIVVTYQKQFQDAGTLGNYTLDFPTYWQDAITYGLAYKISTNYGMSSNDRGMLMKDWQMFLEWAREGGWEEGSIFLSAEKNRW